MRNSGGLEHWNNDNSKATKNPYTFSFLNPLFQYSIIPLFQVEII
jgi:hypothetical protein